jgi:hypothetical protein
MDGNGFRPATASERVMERVEEVGFHWREADQTENALPAAHRSWNVYLEWNEPGRPRDQIFKKMKITGDPRRFPSFALGSWRGIGSEERYALLNEGEKTLSEAGPEERSKPQRDWRGIGIDTAFFVGYQAVISGILYLMPESMTGWTEEDKKATVNKWAKNVKKPHWDTDDLWLNYIAHPYWGATYYIRGRERGFGEFGSFWYSAALSSLYEFGIECFFEQPSIQDLIFTPVGGTLIGKFVFEPIRENIKAKARLRWYDHAGLILTDPLGALNSIFERALGIQSDIQVQFHSPPGEHMAAPPAAGSREWREVRFSFPDRLSIHLQVEWK